MDTTDIVIHDQTITLYPAEKSAYDGDNDYSIVATIDYQNISMLFAGDAEQARLEEILHNDSLARTYDFVKMPHHGRYNELTPSFVEVISPRYAVITSSIKTLMMGKQFTHLMLLEQRCIQREMEILKSQQMAKQ